MGGVPDSAGAGAGDAGGDVASGGVAGGGSSVFFFLIPFSGCGIAFLLRDPFVLVAVCVDVDGDSGYDVSIVGVGTMV